MKSIYPFSEMNIGDVREVSTHRSKKAVYSAAWEWAKKHPNEDGSRPKFNVGFVPQETYFAVPPYTYSIERTA